MGLRPITGAHCSSRMELKRSFLFFQTIMDLLSNAYSIGSDEEEDDDGSRKKPMGPELPRPKRVRMESFEYVPRKTPVYRHISIPTLPTEPPLPGRYISKRERAAMASATVVQSPNPPSLSVTSPGFLLPLRFHKILSF